MAVTPAFPLAGEGVYVFPVVRAKVREKALPPGKRNPFGFAQEGGRGGAPVGGGGMCAGGISAP
jgi:hypothetical protein